MSLAVETAMKILPMVVMGAQYSAMIPQISPELHIAGHMERQEMTCKLAVYTATLPLVTI